MNLIHFCEGMMERRKERRRDYVGLVSNQNVSLLVKSFFNPVQWFSRVTSKVCSISTARKLVRNGNTGALTQTHWMRSCVGSPCDLKQWSRGFWNQSISDLEYTSHLSSFSWHLVSFFLFKAWVSFIVECPTFQIFMIALSYLVQA